MFLHLSKVIFLLLFPLVSHLFLILSSLSILLLGIESLQEMVQIYQFLLLLFILFNQDMVFTHIFVLKLLNYYQLKLLFLCSYILANHYNL